MIFLPALLPLVLVFVIIILFSEEHPHAQRDDNHEEETPGEYGNHRRRSYSRPVEETQQSQFTSLLVMPRAEIIVQQPAHDPLPCRRSIARLARKQHFRSIIQYILQIVSGPVTGDTENY